EIAKRRRFLAKRALENQKAHSNRNRKYEQTVARCTLHAKNKANQRLQKRMPGYRPARKCNRLPRCGRDAQPKAMQPKRRNAKSMGLAAAIDSEPAMAR